MIDFKAVNDLGKAIKWAEASEKQLPFSLSQGLNKTAFEVRTGLNKGTIGSFHMPVKFTQSAFLVEKSTKRKLTSRIYAIDKKGKDRARYLRFGIHGGVRPPKGYERYFEKGVPNDGTIPPGSYFMPGPHVKINAAGNVTLPTLKKITKGLTGQGTKSRSGSKVRGGFFIGTPRNSNFPPGIYRRSRERLFPYFWADKSKPRYTRSFPMQRIASKIVDRRFVKYTQQYLDANIRAQLAGR